MDGMDDSLYEGDSESPEKPDTKTVYEEESMEPTSLVDMKVLTGKHGPPKEGDEIVVKVVKIHGDQAEIQYAPEKPDDDKEESHDDEHDMEELNSKY